VPRKTEGDRRWSVEELYDELGSFEEALLDAELREHGSHLRRSHYLLPALARGRLRARRAGWFVIDWNGREIDAARSRGGVLALADFSDNLIHSDVAQPWPPPAIVQKLYESRQARAFDEPDLAAVTSRLGIYSDLQSLHSEDAITWSYFGPLMVDAPSTRAGFLNWLVERLDLPWTENHSCSIDLWRRVPHPDKSLPGGPELDFVLDGDRCVVFGEAKWLSGEGRGQGRAGDKGQMQLRREFFAKNGPAVYGEREFVVLGVSRSEGDLADSGGDGGGSAVTRSISWADLGAFDGHPKQDEFGRYLEWKTSHSRL